MSYSSEQLRIIDEAYAQGQRDEHEGKFFDIRTTWGGHIAEAMTWGSEFSQKLDQAYKAGRESVRNG